MSKSMSDSEVMTNNRFMNCSILLLEDNPDDAWLLERALTKLGFRNLHLVRDGEEGIAYLSGHGQYADRKRYPVPEFIITDLKMPKLNGLEVLKWLRDNPDFRKVPTLVLTSSRAEQDVASAYGFGANSFLVKPAAFEDLERMGGVIRAYWESCELPKPTPSISRA